MEIAVVVVSLAGLGFAGIAVALAIRQAGLREDRANLANDLSNSQGAVETVKKELVAARASLLGENRMLRDRVAELREKVNALPDNPGNREFVVSELDRVLQGPTTPDHRDEG